MAKRPKLPKDVETAVLTKSRRRCCLCFHLRTDLSEKRGQIAHLDHDPANNREANLAWLCLDHHDEYDGRTSQSKGLTIEEVVTARAELLQRLSSGLPLPSQLPLPETHDRLVISFPSDLGDEFIERGVADVGFQPSTAVRILNLTLFFGNEVKHEGRMTYAPAPTDTIKDITLPDGAFNPGLTLGRSHRLPHGPFRVDLLHRSPADSSQGYGYMVTPNHPLVLALHPELDPDWTGVIVAIANTASVRELVGVQSIRRVRRDPGIEEIRKHWKLIQSQKPGTE